jgi:ATP-dependent DNA helicase DinG
MRQRAAESDVVIVNHHLLCADAAVRQSAYGQVIPECHYSVIDEAHQLEDVATQYFGISVSNYRLDELTRDAARVAGKDEAAEPDTARRAVVADAVHRIRDAARAFFGAVQMLRRVPRFGVGDRTTDERMRLTPGTLDPLADEAYQLVTELQQFAVALGSLPDASEDTAALALRAATIAKELQFLRRASDADYVYFLEVRGRGVFLRAAPIDVSGIIREMLLDRMHATVLTSATLTVGGSFGYVRGRLGVRGGQEMRLPSEFDYGRQAILYLPANMPDPRSPQFVASAATEILQILERTEGRAFVLFTSYANLREVERAIRAVMPYPLLVQGDAPRSALLRDFRETTNAVLLATSSFWQGVDVIGDALSCVIVDKLPFASPGDPITAARIDAIRSRGGEPFDDFQVPVAVLALLQGLGRLIRHRQDRGVLAILDPRLRTKGYGRRFLESLPPAPITSNLAALERFFSPG